MIAYPFLKKWSVSLILATASKISTLQISIAGSTVVVVSTAVGTGATVVETGATVVETGATLVETGANVVESGAIVELVVELDFDPVIEIKSWTST